MIDRFQTTIHRNLLLDRTIGSVAGKQIKQEYLLFYSIKRKNKNNEKINSIQLTI